MPQPSAPALSRLAAEAEVRTPPPNDDGPLYAARRKIYPQRVHGTFRRIKWAVLLVTLGVYYLLPFVRWDRGPLAPHQAVLIDFPTRRFYFFFIEIWPQEVYYFTGLLIIAAMALFLGPDDDANPSAGALFVLLWVGVVGFARAVHPASHYCDRNPVLGRVCAHLLHLLREFHELLILDPRARRTRA